MAKKKPMNPDVPDSLPTFDEMQAETIAHLETMVSIAKEAMRKVSFLSKARGATSMKEFRYRILEIVDSAYTTIEALEGNTSLLDSINPVPANKDETTEL